VNYDLKQFLREHKIAIFLALLTSIIVAFPQVYFRIDHKDLYRDGVEAIELLPDSPRSALVREVQDGHPGIGSIYYKDGKDDPYVYQPLQPMVVAYMGQMFSLDINNTILLSRFILPLIVFLLIYCFVFLLSKDKLAALSSAALLLLADSILSFSGASRLLAGSSPSNFLQLARPVNPAMTYIPFFAFLVVFWLFYRKRDWRLGLASAILLGLNFYNYFYSWTFLYAFGAILILIFLFQKKWSEATRLGSVFLGALIVAIPYFINLYHISLYSTSGDVSARFGMVLSHAPMFVSLTAIVALVIFFLGFPKEDREKYFFSLALLLTPFVTHNQQILTGRIMQVDHYHWFFNKPMAVIMVLLVIFHWLGRQQLASYKKALVVLIILVSVFTGVFTQAVSYSSDRRDGGNIAVERQKYAPVMNWLNENAEIESVVLANSEISHLTVIYTSLNVFHYISAHLSLAATEERIRNALYTFYRLEGVGVKEAPEVLGAERGYISASIYGLYYRELLGSYEAMPDEKFEEIIALYKETLSTPTPVWLEQIFAKYKVEYIVWDKESDPLWRLDQYKFLDKTAEFDDLVIYRVK